MRKTGKLYTLTLVSSGLAILASVLVIFWNDKSSAFHLWADIIPQGFGMASLITSTLIVSTTLLAAAIVTEVLAGRDRRCHEGRYGGRDRRQGTIH
jgi:hypothetical protein